MLAPLPSTCLSVQTTDLWALAPSQPLHSPPTGTVLFPGPRPPPLTPAGLYSGLSHPLGSGIRLWFEDMLGRNRDHYPLTRWLARKSYPVGVPFGPSCFSICPFVFTPQLGGSGVWGMVAEQLPGSLGGEGASLGPLASLTTHRGSWPWPWLLQVSRVRCDPGRPAGLVSYGCIMPGTPAGLALLGLGCPPSSLALCPGPPEPVGICA